MWEISEIIKRAEEREARMDARFVTMLYLQACATGKRTDGERWRRSQFLDELSYTRAILSGEAIEDESPGVADPEDIAKLAKAAGMQAGNLSAEEWAAIQQAERERISKIPN